MQIMGVADIGCGLSKLNEYLMRSVKDRVTEKERVSEREKKDLVFVSLSIEKT